MTGEHAAGGTAGADREPVRRAGNAAALVNGVVSLVVGTAVLVGWMDQAQAGVVTDALVTLGLAVVGIISTLAPIVAARTARGKVTPVAAPAVELAGGTVMPATLVARGYADVDSDDPYGGQYSAG